jgi:hypothetical protein
MAGCFESVVAGPPEKYPVIRFIMRGFTTAPPHWSCRIGRVDFHQALIIGMAPFT